MSHDTVSKHSRRFTRGFRIALYVVANLVYIALAAYGADAWDAPAGRAVYLVTLFALCSAPLLLLQAFNDRYALLGIFMAMYFVNY